MQIERDTAKKLTALKGRVFIKTVGASAIASPFFLSYVVADNSTGAYVRDNWVHSRIDTEIPKPIYSDDELFSFVRTCNVNQAPMTFNVGIYQDGTMATASVEQLHRLGVALGKVK